MKSDVKPVVTSSTSAVLFTGPTRLRGFMVQSKWKFWHSNY
jgi:hypothetical protein